MKPNTPLPALFLLATTASAIAFPSLQFGGGVVDTMHRRDDLTELPPTEPHADAVRNYGWSLFPGDGDLCPADTTSCGDGACCPSSLGCATAANDENSACCPADNPDCRGDIEGAPACADSSWSLWKGFQGNGFCCLVGKVGAYMSSRNVAGVCARSVGEGYTKAALMSVGTGAPYTSVSTVATTGSTATTSASSATMSTSTMTGAATASLSASLSSSISSSLSSSLSASLSASLSSSLVSSARASGTPYCSLVYV